MDIAILSTYEVECGIATYTRHLADALTFIGHRPFIFSEHGPDLPKRIPDNVMPLWNRQAAYDAPHGLGAVLRAIDGSPSPPAAVHIQHEFGLFPRGADVWKFVEGLCARSIRAVITLHTVTTKPRFSDFFGNHTASYGIRARTIVHSWDAYAALLSWDMHGASALTQDLAVLPHGTTVEVDRQPNLRKVSLGLDPELPLVLVPGFMGEGKGQLELLEAIARYRTTPNASMAQFALIGLCRDPNYEAKLRHFIGVYGLHDCLTYEPTFQSTRRMQMWFESADVVLLGSGKTSPYSASGQLATAVGHGLPVIAKDVPIYNAPGGILRYRTEEECARLLYALLHRSEKLRKMLANESIEVAGNQTWTILARKHVKVYET